AGPRGALSTRPSARPQRRNPRQEGERMTTIEIREVGPRDGLQDHKELVPTATKLEMIRRVLGAGVRSVEATSFVSPKVVPQLADAAELTDQLADEDLSNTLVSVFVPTLRWME